MNTEKEKWMCPDVQVQVFEPQEYCETCFTATGTLSCTINDGIEHGYPCAHTRFSISYDHGVLTGIAEELNPNGTVKMTMDINEINVPCGLANVESWRDVGCPNTTWENEDSNGHHYKHKGTCTINDFHYSWEGHPNHS